MFEAEALGQRDEHRCGRTNILRVSALAGRRQDPPPDFNRRDPWPDSGDRARRFRPQGEGRGRRLRIGVAAAAHHVCKVHPDRFDLDQDFAIPGRRLRHILIDQDFGSACLVKPHCFHGYPLWLGVGNLDQNGSRLNCLRNIPSTAPTRATLGARARGAAVVVARLPAGTVQAQPYRDWRVAEMSYMGRFRTSTLEPDDASNWLGGVVGL